MKTLYLMVGIPGAGKSTFAHSNFLDDEFAASDELREKLHLDPVDLSVFPMMENMARERLANNQDICIDSTAILPEHRKKYIDIAKAVNGKAICVVIDTDANTAISRDSKRLRHVPENIIRDMRNSLDKNFPTISEGFDNILVLDSTAKIDREQ